MLEKHLLGVSRLASVKLALTPSTIEHFSLSRSNTTLIAAIVASAFFMEMLDGAIINTSLPQMAASFQVRPLDLSIGITIYLMSAATFVPLSGWLADRFGGRHVFMWAIVVFTVSSLACGVVSNLTQFTLARALQGVGAALMVPVGRVVVLRHTEKADLLRATALITWPALLAPVIAPVLGGFITTYYTWRWNFLLNVPLGVLGVLLVFRFIPDVREGERTKLDWIGFLLSAAALLTLLYGLDAMTQAQAHWLVPAAWVTAGLIVGALAVRHFRRASAPLVNLSAARLPTFAISSITAGAAFRTAINATPFLLPLLFQVGFGLNPLSSGTLVLIYFLGNIAVKPLTSRILRRFGFRTVTVINGIIAGISIMTCAAFSARTQHWLIMSVLLIAGATRSMQFTALNTLTFADISPSQRSSAATLTSMLQQLVAVLGVALGALLLNLSQLLRHNSSVDLTDFRITFTAVGLVALVSAVGFLRLPSHAGAEVSGHLKIRLAHRSAS
jgi:EmrB/QacA subfamily drug resistance transporter